jgi:hypothetical protein
MIMIILCALAGAFFGGWLGLVCGGLIGLVLIAIFGEAE